MGALKSKRNRDAMSITLQECKKALTSPILIVLILLFAAFNVFLIFDYSDDRDELEVANALANTYGLAITGESLIRMEADLKKDLEALHDVVSSTTEQTFASVSEFLEGLDYEVEDLYSDDEWAFFNQMQIKEMYLNVAKSIDEEYDALDWQAIGEAEINKYQLSGQAADTLRSVYSRLSQRFEEIKENGEHKTWFFAGNPYRMHSFLFRTLFRSILYEALLLIVLATALITNFEFENNTHLVTYVTKTGRSLMKHKFVAALLTAAVMVTVILIITLLTYFSVFDYSYLWASAVSSALNWEYDLPYVSWWDFSFVEFLQWGVLLTYASVGLFTALVFAFSVFLKNSYGTFFLFAVFFAAGLLVPGFMPNASPLIFIAHYHPSTLVMNPHYWFMGSSGLTAFKHYEWMTVSLWACITTAVCVLALKRFHHQDIF